MNKTATLFLVIFLSSCSTKVDYTPSSLEAMQEYESLKRYGDISADTNRILLRAGKLYNLTKSATNREDAEHLGYLLKREVEIAKISMDIDRLKKRIKEKNNKRNIIDYTDVKGSDVEKNTSIYTDNNRSLDRDSRILIADQNITEDPIDSEIDIKKSVNGYTLLLKDSYFKEDSLELSNANQKIINRFISMLRGNGSKVVLEADMADKSMDEMTLMTKRVKALRKYMIDSGLDESRVTIKRYSIDDLIK
jgi:outer membrane protein OmpA-like peptidoglycan-associated protein